MNIEVTQVWDSLLATLRMFRIQDLIDIIIVAVIVYYLIHLIQETRAGQLVKGVFAILAMYLIANVCGFRTVKTLMEYVIRYGAILLLVLFQPELRRVLEQVGRRTKLSSIQLFSAVTHSPELQGQARVVKLIDALCDSCAMLSKNRVGALIVIERATKLGEIISTGTIIDADPSTDLIQNIFFPNTPLHDGALIVREERIYAAACFLPLSENYEISRTLGTRHRAALGMSEVSDAIIIVVSEETGNISVAKNGKLNLRLTANALNSILQEELLDTGTGQERKKLFPRKNRTSQKGEAKKGDKP